MNHLSVLLNNCNIGCGINGTLINHLMYADDACLIAPSPGALQKMLNICQEFAIDNSIVYNEKKTKLMCFKPKSLSDLYVPNIYLNNQHIHNVDNHRYLGMIIKDNLHDDYDIVRQTKALYIRGNVVTRKFSKCTKEVKNSLFKSYCSDMYGSVVWTMYKQRSLQKCRVAYNDVYRKLFNIKRGEHISAAFVFNNVDCFNVLQRKCANSFRIRLLKSENVLIGAIMSSLYFQVYSSLSKRWNDLLFI